MNKIIKTKESIIKKLTQVMDEYVDAFEDVSEDIGSLEFEKKCLQEEIDRLQIKHTNLIDDIVQGRRKLDASIEKFNNDVDLFNKEKQEFRDKEDELNNGILELVGRKNLVLDEIKELEDIRDGLSLFDVKKKSILEDIHNLNNEKVSVSSEIDLAKKELELVRSLSSVTKNEMEKKVKDSEDKIKEMVAESAPPFLIVVASDL